MFSDIRNFCNVIALLLLPWRNKCIPFTSVNMNSWIGSFVVASRWLFVFLDYDKYVYLLYDLYFNKSLMYETLQNFLYFFFIIVSVEIQIFTLLDKTSRCALRFNLWFDWSLSFTLRPPYKMQVLFVTITDVTHG